VLSTLKARGQESLSPATTAQVDGPVVFGDVALIVTKERSGTETGTTVLKYVSAPGVTVSVPSVVGMPPSAPLTQVVLDFTLSVTGTPAPPSMRPVSATAVPFETARTIAGVVTVALDVRAAA